MRPCEIDVTGAGGTFRVLKTGTAIIHTQDELGQPVLLKMANTLISPHFSYKMLALKAFTSKGLLWRKMKCASLIRLQTAFIGKQDPHTQLFFLPNSPVPEQRDQTHLASSYGSSSKSDRDTLWQLHMRHGHRNFADLARQYGLSLPKEVPASLHALWANLTCIHTCRADWNVRHAAQGWHSDFRGPFSVPTEHGELYLLTIIVDFSRRIFGFLVRVKQNGWIYGANLW